MWRSYLKKRKEMFLDFFVQRGKKFAMSTVKYLCQFCNTYFCKAAFSTLTTIKNKYRSCLKSTNLYLKNCIEQHAATLYKIASEEQGHPFH